jgi:uncharacterized protein YjbI with pentapeptide repeats
MVSAARPGPARPRPPKALTLGTLDEDDLRDDAAYQAIGFYDLTLTGRSAKTAQFVQCRFNRADLTGTALSGAILTDCLLERTALDHVHADHSVLHRVTLRDCGMAGLQWLGGTLRDVTVRDSRAEHSVFRDAQLHSVFFTSTDLTGADFTDADLTGATFSGCDLSEAVFTGANATGARFESCTMAGAAGVEGLAGSSMAGADTDELLRLFAGALEITLTDD